MKNGKIGNDRLAEIIGRNRIRRPEVLVGPGIGKDYAALELGGDVCVVSSDPVTAAGRNAGRIAVHVAVNDAAVCGADPVGILTVILLPPRAGDDALDRLTKEIAETCETLGIDVLGGHTEVTGAVSKPVVVSTVIARTPRKSMVRPDGARPGDAVLLTKTAGLEGTAILAADQEARVVKAFGAAFARRCRSMLSRISVLGEGRIGAAHGATSMHDVTEGGVLGALWEAANAAGAGVEAEEDAIPVAPETAKICGLFGLDPLKLISSGAMLVTCPPAKAEGMIRAMAEAGIPCVRVGTMLRGEEGMRLRTRGGRTRTIRMPSSDEIHRV